VLQRVGFVTYWVLTCELAAIDEEYFFWCLKTLPETVHSKKKNNIIIENGFKEYGKIG